MKIIHIYKTYFPDTFGGVEEVIRNISETVDAEFKLITLSKNSLPNPNSATKNLEIVRFKKSFEMASCPFSMELLTGFKKQVQDADILHYHFPWPFADLLHVINNIKKPTLVTFHSDIVKQKKLQIFYQPLMKKFLNKVDKIIVASQNYLTSSEILQQYKNKCEVIPFGIAEKNYSKNNFEKMETWRKKIGSEFGLFVGVLRYYKGLHFLLEALKNVSIPFVIAGDGPEMQKLRKLAAELELKNIYFTGRVSDEDKCALLQLSRFVVMPSHLRSEAFGISLVEGLMFGKPLISCEIGTATSFVNQDQKTGFVIPPANPSALAQAMDKLYQDKNLANEMGIAAIERYKNYFTAEKMGKAYAAVYNKLIEGTRG